MDGQGDKGLRVLISAAGGGAGRVIARDFHRAGHRVLACDVTADGLEALAGDCPGLLTQVADAGSEADVAALFERMDDALGGIDVLVNNVGISGPTAAVEDITLDAWDETLRVNLTGHFLACRAAAPRMKAQGSGLIVNISSGSAKLGLPMRTPYVVTKGAILSLTLNLARELGPFGIRVNAILPGAIRGPRLERIIAEKAAALGADPEAFSRQVLRYVSMRTMVEPEDIAATLLFLASPGGARITGQMLGVDGNVEWEE